MDEKFEYFGEANHALVKARIYDAGIAFQMRMCLGNPPLLATA